MKRLFFNAVFHSMRNAEETFSAVLVEEGTISDVFSVPPSIESCERVDLGGTYVFPGFIDTHTHSFEGGLYTLGADLSRASSLEELFDLLKATPPISGKLFAWRFNEDSVAEKRFPTVAELDKAFPDIPVLIRRVDGHSCTTNSAALKAIPWAEHFPAGTEPRFFKEKNRAITRWFHKSLDEEGILRAYAAASEQAVLGGCTTVHAMIGDGESNLQHYELVSAHLNDFPVEFILYPQITDVNKALSVESPRIGGCLLVDGSFGSHSAALLEPYADQPTAKGELYRSDEFWETFLSEADRAGLQTAVHAIGDAAVYQISRIHAALKTDRASDLRHMIIHAELTNDEILATMERAGLYAVMQPEFDRLWGGTGGYYAKVLGEERALRTNRLKSSLERGIPVTGSSDWYVTELNALAGIHAAVHMHNAAERLSPFEALCLYTRSAARLSFDESRLGLILPGYQADMTMLAKNPLCECDIRSIAVRGIVKRGKLIPVHEP